MTAKITFVSFMLASIVGGVFAGWKSKSENLTAGWHPATLQMKFENQEIPKVDGTADNFFHSDSTGAKVLLTNQDGTGSPSQSNVTRVKMKGRTTLGVHVSKVDSALRKHLKIPAGTGLIVDHVTAQSGAEKSKLKKFDVLYMLADQILVNAEQLSVLIEMKEAGDKVNLTVIREGQKVEIEAELTSRMLPDSIRGFDAFHYFHGHAGRMEFQDCSVCHVSPHPEKLDRLDGSIGSAHNKFDNYHFFHGVKGKAEFQDCSKCHTQAVSPLDLKRTR